MEEWNENAPGLFREVNSRIQHPQ